MAAYFVFNYHINNQGDYRPYLAEVPKVLEAYGAEILAADLESEPIEGEAGEVTVILRFSSKEAARKWYESPEYQEIIGSRTENSVGIASLANPASA